MLYATTVRDANDSSVSAGHHILNGVMVAGVASAVNNAKGFHGVLLRTRGQGTARAFTRHWSSQTDKVIPLPFKIITDSIASPGCLHHVCCGIGDPGVSVVPQTLHTIDLGVSA